MTDTKEGAPANLGREPDAPDAAAPGASIAIDEQSSKIPTGQQPTALVMRRAANLILDVPAQLAPGGAEIAGELRARALLMDLEIIRNGSRRGRMADVVRNLLTRIGVVVS